MTVHRVQVVPPAYLFTRCTEYVLPGHAACSGRRLTAPNGRHAACATLATERKDPLQQLCQAAPGGSRSRRALAAEAEAQGTDGDKGAAAGR